MALINLRNVIFEVRDGTPTTPNKLKVKIGNGNLTYDEKRNIQYILDRGILDKVRLGDDAPVEVKFDFEWEFITGTGFDTTFAVEDALKQRGSASAWVTSSPDVCEPYCVDLYMFNIIPCSGLQSETLALPEYRYETLSHDPKAGTISSAGKCNVLQATATRASSPTT